MHYGTLKQKCYECPHRFLVIEVWGINDIDSSINIQQQECFYLELITYYYIQISMFALWAI